MTRARPAEHNPFMSRNAVNRASFVIGVEGSNIINVGIQLKDADGNDIAVRAAVKAYLSSDVNGDTLAVAPSGGVAIGTDGLLLEPVADRVFVMVSESDGDIDINITEVTALTMFLILVMPDGSLVASGAITFA